MSPFWAFFFIHLTPGFQFGSIHWKNKNIPRVRNGSSYFLTDCYVLERPHPTVTTLRLQMMNPHEPALATEKFCNKAVNMPHGGSKLKISLEKSLDKELKCHQASKWDSSVWLSHSLPSLTWLSLSTAREKYSHSRAPGLTSPLFKKVLQIELGSCNASISFLDESFRLALFEATQL